MDLSSGAREFHDIDDAEDLAEEEHYKSLSLGQKILFKIKNW